MFNKQTAKYHLNAFIKGPLENIWILLVSTKLNISGREKEILKFYESRMQKARHSKVIGVSEMKISLTMRHARADNEVKVLLKKERRIRTNIWKYIWISFQKRKGRD